MTKQFNSLAFELGKIKRTLQFFTQTFDDNARLDPIAVECACALIDAEIDKMNKKQKERLKENLTTKSVMPLFVRCSSDKTIFEVDRETLMPKTCSIYAPECFGAHPESGKEYIDIVRWDYERMKISDSVRQR